MTRFALTLEYDGGPFVGLQRQTQGQSIQQAVEEAAHATTGETVTMTAAGRCPGIGASGRGTEAAGPATGHGRPLATSDFGCTGTLLRMTEHPLPAGLAKCSTKSNRQLWKVAIWR